MLEFVDHKYVLKCYLGLVREIYESNGYKVVISSNRGLLMGRFSMIRGDVYHSKSYLMEVDYGWDKMEEIRQGETLDICT